MNYIILDELYQIKSKKIDIVNLVFVFRWEVCHTKNLQLQKETKINKEESYLSNPSTRAGYDTRSILLSGV